MRVAVVSVMCSDFHETHPWAVQELYGAEVSFHRWDDRTFPPRVCTLRPRMQARIPKCFAWEMAPDHDVYVYVDASFTIVRPDALAWLLYRLDDFAAFSHPIRSTIAAEATYLREHGDDRYLRSRYENEDLDAALEAIPVGYEDDKLYATGVFAYRDTPVMRQMLTEWWVHQTRYHLNCQLSLPHLLWKHRLRVAAVEGNIYSNPYFVHTQNRAWKKANANPA